MARLCREPAAKRPREGDATAEESGMSDDLVVVEVCMVGPKLTQLLSLSTTRVVIALPHHVLCPLSSIKENMWPFAAFCQQMFQDLDHPQWEVKSSAHTHMHAHWFGSLLTSCRCLGVIAILHRNEVKCSSCHSIKGNLSVCPASAHCLRMAW